MQTQFIFSRFHGFHLEDKCLLALCRPVATLLTTRVSSFKSRENEEDEALVKSECCGFAHESNQKEEDLPYQPPFSFPLLAASRASERSSEEGMRAGRSQ